MPDEPACSSHASSSGPAPPRHKVVAICQSNYIPWKGYFDLINFADEFILLDDVQYTRRDWRNRNKIKTPQGTQWLTLSVKVKGKYDQLIKDTEIVDSGWTRSHFETLRRCYSRAPHFRTYADWLAELYADRGEVLLSQVNRRLLEALCAALGIQTRFAWSWDYPHGTGKTERLLELCRAAGATEYLSGPAAQDYLDVDTFAQHGIRVRWMDYRGYPEYPQLFGEFDHAVSVLDLLLNTGSEAPRYMKSFSA